jgi:hypothetical protein
LLRTTVREKRASGERTRDPLPGAKKFSSAAQASSCPRKNGLRSVSALEGQIHREGGASVWHTLC